MLEGKYTDGYLADAGEDAPKFTDVELKIIASPLDFVGINAYRPIACVLADDVPPGWREIPFAKAHPKMFNSWLALGPEAITGHQSSCSRCGGRRKSTLLRTDAGGTTQVPL